MLTNVKKGIMGTIEFDAQFKGMRKPQDFIVYPLHAGGDPTRIKIQSDTRIGIICFTSGRVLMSPPVASGAHTAHLVNAKEVDKLSAEEVLLLKAAVFSTAGKSVGSNGIVTTDNSAASEVFDSALGLGLA